MIKSLLIRTFAGIFIFSVYTSCNQNPGKIKVKKVSLEEIKQEEKKEEPAPPPPPPPNSSDKIDMAEKYPNKCYKNQGLKYITSIRVFYTSSHEIISTIEIYDYEGRMQGAGSFQGEINKNTFNIASLKQPPAIGDASEWTEKPWVLKTARGKEILQLVFNAKNYESNKWEETVYDFELTTCN